MPPKKAPVVKLPPVLPKGHVLFDKNKKKHWTLIRQIGSGGFGRIYESQCTETKEVAVVKMEHLESGPLFCEQNFAVRCLKKEVILSWAKQHAVDHVPVPEFFSFGVTDDGLFRYVVMQRLGRNLEQVLETFGWHMPEILTFQIAIEMINALEFIHSNGYVHADVKGSNIIFGYDNAETHSIYLVDFGLVAKVPTVYKEDKRQKHNGTVEYTSREAHRGAAPSRRGDFEILAYCLLHWMNGSLPWGASLTNPETVSTSKHSFFEKLPKSLSEFFPKTPAELVDFFCLVSRMPYELPPDYNTARKIFTNALQKRKARTMPFNLDKPSSKNKSVLSPPRPQIRKVEAVTPAQPVAACSAPVKSSGSNFVVTHGPLAVAMARNRKPESNGNSHADLKRKHDSPAASKRQVSVATKNKTPIIKPCTEVLKNRDLDDDDDSDDDRSFLYKTAFPDPVSSSEDEMPTVTIRKPLLRRRP